MNACVSPLGHQWSDEDPDLTWGSMYGFRPKLPGATFHGEHSVMVVCRREGCNEIGYRISGSEDKPEEGAA